MKRHDNDSSQDDNYYEDKDNPHHDSSVSFSPFVRVMGGAEKGGSATTTSSDDMHHDSFLLQEAEAGMPHLDSFSLGSRHEEHYCEEQQHQEGQEEDSEEEYEDTSEEHEESQEGGNNFSFVNDPAASMSMEHSFSVFALLGQDNPNPNGAPASKAMEAVTEEHGKGEEEDDSDYNPEEDEDESISLSYDEEEESIDLAEEQEKRVRRILCIAFLSAIGIVALGKLFAKLMSLFSRNNNDEVADLAADQAGETAGDAAGAVFQKGAMDASQAALHQSTSNFGAVYVPMGEGAGAQ